MARPNVGHLFAVIALLSGGGCASVIGADDYKAGGGASAGYGGATGGYGGGTGGYGGATGGSSGSSSGDTLCTATCADARFSCERPSTVASSIQGVCVEACPVGDECDSSHQCISGTSIGFASSCLRDCTDATCADGMSCTAVPSATGGTLSVCVPDAWGQGSGKEIGAPCNANSQCASGDCAGTASSTRWCTEVCTVGNGMCGWTASSTTYAWCVTNTTGAASCFPDCTVNSDCSQFTGTVCKSATDVYGTTVSVCSTP